MKLRGYIQIICAYAYTYIHAITVKKETMILKKSRKKYIEGFGGLKEREKHN